MRLRAQLALRRTKVALKRTGVALMGEARLRPELPKFLSLGGPGSLGNPAKRWGDEAPHILARFPGPPGPPKLKKPRISGLNLPPLP